MKKVFIFITTLFFWYAAEAQVGIGTTTPSVSSALEVRSTSLGVLPPRMTTQERDAIPVTPTAKGLIIFNLDTKVLNLFDGVTWHAIVNHETVSICSENTSYASLLACLQQNYTPSQTLGYNVARDILYSEIDVNPITQELKGIYSDYTVIMDYSTSPDPSVHAFNRGINAEHVFPQSMGASLEPAQSDMFNIFPSKIEVNFSRGNCPFGEIVDADTEVWYYLTQELTTQPTMAIDNYSEKDNETTYPLLTATQQCSFEPSENRKGDIARAVFYFYTIYNSINNNTYPEYANDAFFNSMKTTLLQWHNQDPVDQIEMERNNKIKLYQGNDNPFIIDATLAERLFN
ncbi:hypothetical protein EQG68_10260 [Flavobacterium piscinae]|uniref:Endonuclease I n=1 Tax=Flavobacterium piscinae TaxID=2506424 RepID=A0A4Q1KP91_9FLAO|nr:endonuclease [Flavobacterium piscinae]RXR31260.1 hypothetical protein EQG68_10260 [Flavobacterium piscinae]